jgi:hypothetical protein
MADPKIAQLEKILNMLREQRGMSPGEKATKMKDLNIGFDKDTGKAIMPDVEPAVLQEDVNKIMAEKNHMISLENSAQKKGWKTDGDSWVTPEGHRINKKEASNAFLNKYGEAIKGKEVQPVSDAISTAAKGSVDKLSQIGKPGSSQFQDFKNFAGGIGEALSIPQRAAFQYAGEKLGIRPDKEGLVSGQELVNPLLKQIAVGTPEDKERFAGNVSPIVGAGVDVVADPLNFIPGPSALNKLNKAKKVLGPEHGKVISDIAGRIRSTGNAEERMEIIRNAREAKKLDLSGQPNYHDFPPEEIVNNMTEKEFYDQLGKETAIDRFNKLYPK